MYLHFALHALLYVFPSCPQTAIGGLHIQKRDDNSPGGAIFFDLQAPSNTTVNRNSQAPLSTSQTPYFTAHLVVHRISYECNVCNSEYGVMERMIINQRIEFISRLSLRLFFFLSFSVCQFVSLYISISFSVCLYL